MKSTKIVLKMSSIDACTLDNLLTVHLRQVSRNVYQPYVKTLKKLIRSLRRQIFK